MFLNIPYRTNDYTYTTTLNPKQNKTKHKKPKTKKQNKTKKTKKQNKNKQTNKKKTRLILH